MTAYIAVWPSGIVVRWRALKGTEHRKYSNLLRQSQPMAVYNDIYRLVVLEGPDISEVTAGIVHFIGNSVLNWSAYSNDYPTVKAKIDEARTAIVGDYLQSAKAIIASIFRYTIDEIDEWDSDKLFQHIAMAEIVSRRPIEPLDPLAEEEKKKTNSNKKDEAPKNKPKPNQAQQMVLERVRRSRGA